MGEGGIVFDLLGWIGCAAFGEVCQRQDMGRRFVNEAALYASKDSA